MLQPLERGGGLGLGLAQARQPGGRHGLGGRRLLLLGLGGGGALLRGGHRPRRGGGLRAGARMGDQQQQRLVAADLGGQRAVALRRPGLPAQRIDPGGDRRQHVLDPREVVFGRAQPQLRLVPAGMQAADARRILQDAPARLGLGGDHLGHLPLAHHRRRARARRRVGEQQLHVARPHLAAVDAVGRALAPVDAPGDLQHVGGIEGGRRRAGGVVEAENHLGVAAAGPVTGARKDHVVHAGRAHVLVRVLAHDPAQGLDEVRLAAAVRADDAGEARLDEKFARLDEGLEADDAQAGELHRGVDGRSSGRAAIQRPRGPAAAPQAPTIGLMIFSMPSMEVSPWCFCPLMKKVGVELTLNTVMPRSFTALIPS